MRRPASLLLLVLPACFYVTERERAERWDVDGDGLERPTDCDDQDPELGDLSTWYADLDGDGYGDPDGAFASCGRPDAAAENDGDCDDDDGNSHPEAAERCDGADNDCDGQVDEELSDIPWYRDADGDDYGDTEVREVDCAPPEGFVALDGDCDDDDDAVHPDATELCGPVDEDCDGLFDDDPDLVPPTWYPDDDQDGHGQATGGRPGCDPPPIGTWAQDDLDCRDDDADIGPGEEEVCDGVDNNCDEIVDEDASDRLTYYRDVDQDLYGDPLDSIQDCPPTPAGYVSNAGDCDDGRSDVHQGADELCANSRDDNCDNRTDETPCL